MASVMQLRSGAVLYNVSHSVGKFGRNRKTDVQLLQVLLNALIRHIKSTGMNLPGGQPVPELLPENGVCDSKTMDAILWYQQSQSGMATDATVNSIDSTDLSEKYGRPGNYKYYTMWALNAILEARKALPSQSDITVEPLASEVRKFPKKLHVWTW
jgi:hypothetical protein